MPTAKWCPSIEEEVRRVKFYNVLCHLATGGPGIPRQRPRTCPRAWFSTSGCPGAAGSILGGAGQGQSARADYLHQWPNGERRANRRMIPT